MELREIIASNISELRAEKRITQSKLAEVLNYSDKAVSKWERGESIPDVTVLKQIADYFGVTVDYLLTETHEQFKTERAIKKKSRTINHVIISLLAVGLVWLIATALFIHLDSISVVVPAWVAFVGAVPVSCVLLLIFNSIWGKPNLNFLIISVLAWTAILFGYLLRYFIAGHNFWLIFLIGIPVQVILLLSAGLRKTK